VSSNERVRWASKGACVNLDPVTADNIFFDTKSGRPSKDNAWSPYCSNCPVTNKCLEWALVNDVEGVWGNTTKNQRDSLFLANYKAELMERAQREGWLETQPSYGFSRMSPKAKVKEPVVVFLFDFEIEAAKL
jgi:hypothetical protein